MPFYRIFSNFNCWILYLPFWKLTKMVTLYLSALQDISPRAYFVLERAAVCSMTKLAGRHSSKKDFTIWRAWLRLESDVPESTVISRLSANQADSASASPCPIYLAIGMKTSYPEFCAFRLRQASIAAATETIFNNFRILAN